MRFELASYAPNVEAGEDVRIILVFTGGPWPDDVPCEDFWLIDSSELARHQSRPWAAYLREHHPEITSYLATATDQS